MILICRRHPVPMSFSVDSVGSGGSADDKAIRALVSPDLLL